MGCGVRMLTDKELKEFQDSYIQAYKNGKHAIKQWFLDHYDLGLHELCFITGYSEAYLSEFRRNLSNSRVLCVDSSDGFKLTCYRPMPRVKSKEIDIGNRVIEDRNELIDVVAKLYSDGFGVRKIAYKFKIDVNAVYYYLKLRGIKVNTINDIRSRNKCNNVNWIKEHYIDKGLSLAKCAKLAGVSRSTFTAWLVNYGMFIRSRYCHASILDEKMSKRSAKMQADIKDQTRKKHNNNKSKGSSNIKILSHQTSR